MTITTESYIDDPIVRVIVEGTVTDAQIRQMHSEVLSECEQIGVCYIILDARGAEATLHEIIALLLSDRIAAMQSTGQLHVVLVGSPSPNEVLDNINLPVFTDPDEAELYIQQQVATHSAGSSDDQDS
jgi:hypothetical protein